jgi:hypothetical protein
MEPFASTNQVRAYQESASEKQKQQSGLAGEFFNSLAHSAIAEPLGGLSQLVDYAAGTKLQKSVEDAFSTELGISSPQQAEFGTARWAAQQLGCAIGMAPSFLLLSRGVRMGATKLCGEAAIASGATDLGLRSAGQFSRLAGKEIALSATSGFAYDSLLRPSQIEDGSSLLDSRFKAGCAGAVTFGTLSGTGLCFNRLGSALAVEGKNLSSIVGESLTSKQIAGIVASTTLKNPISAGIFQAVPAGLVSAEAQALNSNNLLPTWKQAQESVGSLAFVGGTLGGSHYIGQQRDGTARTNLDYVLDKAVAAATGKSVQQSFNEGRTFKLLAKPGSVQDFVSHVRDGRSAQTVVPVREYLGQGLFGTGSGTLGRLGLWGDKFGETRQLMLRHNEPGEPLMPLSQESSGQCGLIATCELIDPSVGSRSIFKQHDGRSNDVWLNQSGGDRLTLSTTPGTADGGALPSMRLGSNRRAVTVDESIRSNGYELRDGALNNVEPVRGKLTEGDAQRILNSRNRWTENDLDYFLRDSNYVTRWVGFEIFRTGQPLDAARLKELYAEGGRRYESLQSIRWAIAKLDPALVEKFDLDRPHELYRMKITNASEFHRFADLWVKVANPDRPFHSGLNPYPWRIAELIRTPEFNRLPQWTQEFLAKHWSAPDILHQSLSRIGRASELFDCAKAWKAAPDLPKSIAGRIGVMAPWKRVAGRLAWEDATREIYYANPEEANYHFGTSLVTEEYLRANRATLTEKFWQHFNARCAQGRDATLQESGDLLRAIGTLHGKSLPQTEMHLIQQLVKQMPEHAEVDDHVWQRAAEFEMVRNLRAGPFRDALRTLVPDLESKMAETRLKQRRRIVSEKRAAQNFLEENWEPKAALALSTVFGRQWSRWLDQQTKLGLSHHDASFWLPAGLPSQFVGLPEFLFKYGGQFEYSLPEYSSYGREVVAKLGDRGYAHLSTQAAVKLSTLVADNVSGRYQFTAEELAASANKILDRSGDMAVSDPANQKQIIDTIVSHIWFGRAHFKSARERIRDQRLSALAIIAGEWKGLSDAERQLPLKELIAAISAKKYKGFKNQAFAAESAQWGVSEQSYEKYEPRFIASQAVPSPFPLNLAWEDGGLSGRFLKRSDPRGLYLGHHTNCCQHPNNAGSACAWYGQEKPNSGFFVVEDGSRNIVAQSWAWVADNGGLCFDNIEAKGLGGNEGAVANIYNKAAADLSKQFHTITLGAHSDLNTKRWTPAKLHHLQMPPNFHGYHDSSKQVLLAHEPPAAEKPKSDS